MVGLSSAAGLKLTRTKCTRQHVRLFNVQTQLNYNFDQKEKNTVTVAEHWALESRLLILF